ncbi:hypothetical protein ZIOFF_000654 [Zingiber officinale]|uniref:Uncharacterized protein n=1 Tax=Zingiber officinale TaxID=94328 RepID=A0A8J5HTW3_ZINOF|nr:hypothetical protein ZIOFF_000654 [Zingiber officinale]
MSFEIPLSSSPPPILSFLLPPTSSSLLPSPPSSASILPWPISVLPPPRSDKQCAPSYLKIITMASRLFWASRAASYLKISTCPRVFSIGSQQLHSPADPQCLRALHDHEQHLRALGYWRWEEYHAHQLLDGMFLKGLRQSGHGKRSSNSNSHLHNIDAMTAIKEQYRIQRNWMGDPCSPSVFVWDGLTCDYSLSNSPRVTALSLSSSGLTGEITKSFASLSALQNFDLTGNRLNGSIPSNLLEMAQNGLLTLRWIQDSRDQYTKERLDSAFSAYWKLHSLKNAV